MEQQDQEYIEIDLLRLVQALWRRAWAIVLAAVLLGGAGFALAFWVLPPEYEATALMYVNNSSISVGSTSISLSDLSASQTLVDTYIAILNTRLTLNDVIEKAGLEYTYEEIMESEMIEAEAVNGTEIFAVTVTSESPREAEQIANTIVEVLPDKIAQVVDGSSVRTVDYAVAPEKRSGPSITRFTFIGVLCGLVLSCGAIVALELLDEQIHSEDYLLQTYHLPVLAAVPDLLDSKSGKGGYYGSYYEAAGRERS